MYTIRCITCKKDFDTSKMNYTCPDCGELKGTLEILYDLNKPQIKDLKNLLQNESDPSISRYLPFLPVGNTGFFPSLQTGMTPLYHIDHPQLKDLFIKDDSRFPSLSAKDRATVISVAKGLEFGFETFTTASTGNAAASLACIAANLGIETIIFVPKSIPPAKLLQLQVFGAHIIGVEGNYDAAFDLCAEACTKFGWYNRSTAVNPYNLEGKKTAAFEICEQLNFQPPDLVFIPVGDGCILSGMWKGFCDFQEAGMISHVPRLVACQSKGSAAVCRAFDAGMEFVEPVVANSIADSIAVDLPREGVKALRALRDSDGFAIAVNDADIVSAIHELAKETGIFVEPSAAVTFAGMKQALNDGLIDSQQSVLLLLTGSGLKDLKTAGRSVNKKNIFSIDPFIGNPIEKIKDRFVKGDI